MVKVRSTISLLLVFLLTAACSSGGGMEERLPRSTVPFTTDISINEIMIAQIDHASHFIWEAAASKNQGTEPDWKEIEHHAIQLISSRSAMTMGGAGVNDAMWVVQSDWRDFVTQMNDASLQALTAARQRNMTALGRAGDYLVESCEGCHRQFKPSIPTEGLMHPH